MAAAGAKLVGKLTVNVVSGKNLKDMELIGKMDPYVTLKCGKEEFKTKVQKKAGTNPTFNQSFIFNLEGKEDALHVNVLDEELLSDAHVGRVDIPLLTLVKTDKQTAYQLVSKNDFKKVTGDIIIKCESFIGTGAPNPAAPPPAPAPVAAAPKPQPVMQQQVMYAAAPQPVVMMAAPQPQLVQGADGKLYAVQAQPQQQVVYMQPGMMAAQPQVVYMQQPKPY